VARVGADGPQEHPAIAPLSFLLGRWAGTGKGDYPTIEAFDFIQELAFTHIGKPYLIYTSRSWRLEMDADGMRAKGAPLAVETGFWRPQPDNRVEALLVHPTGITEIYLGEVTGTKIEMATDAVVRTDSAKPYTAGHRLYGLVDSARRPGGKDLAYAFDMAAMGQPLQPHLWAAHLELIRAGLPAGKLKPPGDSRFRVDRLDKAGQPGGPVYALE
jgi:nitrobindin-like protein